MGAGRLRRWSTLQRQVDYCSHSQSVLGAIGTGLNFVSKLGRACRPWKKVGSKVKLLAAEFAPTDARNQAEGEGSWTSMAQWLFVWAR